MSLVSTAIKSFTRKNLEQVPSLTPFANPYGIASATGNPLLQLNALADSGWLFAVVERIASSVAAAEWQLFQAGRDGERREVFEHDLLALWNMVNPFYTRHEFLETSVQHFCLTGEMWWLVIRGVGRRPIELWPVRPDRMRPVPSKEKFLSGYLYTIGAERVPLELEDVIFIRRPSPVDPYRGIGVVQSLLPDIDSENMARLWTRNFFRNNAEPGGIIELDQDMDDAEFARYTQRWQEQHKGIGNAHRVAVLERGHWVDRKLSQRDMQFEQLRKLNRDVILGAFGMPLAMLGISESVNRANAEAAELMFARWIIRPILERIKQAANEYLVPAFGDNLRLAYIDPSPDDRQLNLLEATSGYEKRVLTLNEARARLGESEIEGGDEIAPPPSPIPAAFSLPSASSAKAQLLANPLRTPAEERGEAGMERGWTLRLRQERTAIIERLSQSEKGLIQKVGIADLEGHSWDWWAKYGESVVEELSAAFAVALTAAYPELPGAEVQKLAGAWARERGARLLRLDGDMNLAAVTRARVNELVAHAIENGESLQTLARDIRTDFMFSKERAERVARTESATALGMGQKQGAVSQGRDEKRWLTQGDDLVEEECAANEAAGWIGIDDLFPTGVDTIPEHPACRCTCIYRTKALHQEEGILCPRCHKRLPINRLKGKAVVYCKRCNASFEIGDEENGHKDTD